MSVWPVVVLVLVSAVTSVALTGLMRSYALRTQLLDQPNERSSHTVATPRGGGLGFVFAFLGAMLGIGKMHLIQTELLIACAGAGSLVAILGFLDDRSPMPARWRFAGHAVAAVWILAWLGPLPPVPLLGVRVNMAWAATALCWLYLVWMINLFNFMDGIDGLAGVEAITTTLSGALIWWLAGSGPGWIVAVVFAACVCGFLFWNFPPARIFMGDAGSGFLGVTVGLLSLWCAQAQSALFWSWLILVGFFMVDATTTLVRRVRRGERAHQPHRNHAYQFAARRLGRHLPVTLACAAINLFWLLPVALLVALARLDGVLGVLIAYAPLCWLAFRYKAGDRASQEA
jgi:Fuc2NAc and GlcNAc transferase